MNTRTIWETRTGETDDERLADRLTERPAARTARIARKAVDPETEARIRRALGMEG